MKILVASCDKNVDLFEPFHHCLEKYWSDHPEVVYITETVVNPYYKTVCYNYSINQWTTRMRKVLSGISDSQILLIMDDCFIREPVSQGRIDYASNHLSGNVAMFNFEKSFDSRDEATELEGFKKRRPGSPYEVSIMCGLWQRDKLIKVLDRDCSPWMIELEQDNKGFDYYINSSDWIINWGYESGIPCNIFRGRWCKSIVPFFEKEGIKIDYLKRGFRE